MQSMELNHLKNLNRHLYSFTINYSITINLLLWVILSTAKGAANSPALPLYSLPLFLEVKERQRERKASTLDEFSFTPLPSVSPFGRVSSSLSLWSSSFTPCSVSFLWVIIRKWLWTSLLNLNLIFLFSFFHFSFTLSLSKAIFILLHLILWRYSLACLMEVKVALSFTSASLLHLHLLAFTDLFASPYVFRPLNYSLPFPCPCIPFLFFHCKRSILYSFLPSYSFFHSVHSLTR